MTQLKDAQESPLMPLKDHHSSPPNTIISIGDVVETAGCQLNMVLYTNRSFRGQRQVGL